MHLGIPRRLLAEIVADGAAPAATRVTGPAGLAETFARQLSFRRKVAAPTRMSGLRIWAVRRGASTEAPSDAPGAMAPVGPDEHKTAISWLDACEAEGGVPERRRTPGAEALAMFGAGLLGWRVGRCLVAICGVVGDERAPGGRRIALVRVRRAGISLTNRGGRPRPPRG